eukprot:Gb_14816 [translate_table: standard]
MGVKAKATLLAVIALLTLCGQCHAVLQDIEVVTKADGSLNFLVVGDWGRKGHYNQSNVATQACLPCPVSDYFRLFLAKIGEELDIDFVISTGDNFYEDGLTGVADKSFQESFSNIYTTKSLQKPWHGVLGNHDYRGNVLAQLNPVLRSLDHRWNCKRSFTLKSSLCTSFTETRCLSSVQLFFVDTTPFVDKYWEMPNKHKYDWRGILPRRKYLRRQLQDVTMALNASNATWKIVVGHHPIRSVGHHGDTSELIQQLLPILEANDVDLYINGHDHCLEHISSITSPIQFFTSGGGSKAWKGIDQEANMDGLQMYYDGQGFMSIEINPTTLRAAFYDAEGNAIHELYLSNEPYTSPYLNNKMKIN